MADILRRLGTPLLLLTTAAACTDAVSYLGLGHVFPANMTGNTVLLGIGIADGDYAAAGRSACALGGFVLGAALAGAVHGGRKDLRRGALVGELCVLITVAAWWIAVGHAAGATRFGLITLAGIAMGLQSGTIARLGLTAVSTTYITGTWTAVSGWFGTALRHSAKAGAAPVLQAGVVVSYLVAAFGAGAIFHRTGEPAAVFPAALVLLTLLTVALPSVSGRLLDEPVRPRRAAQRAGRSAPDSQVSVRNG